jgi:hypothetical protein
LQRAAESGGQRDCQNQTQCAPPHTVVRHRLRGREEELVSPHLPLQALQRTSTVPTPTGKAHVPPSRNGAPKPASKVYRPDWRDLLTLLGNASGMGGISKRKSPPVLSNPRDSGGNRAFLHPGQLGAGIATLQFMLAGRLVCSTASPRWRVDDR